MEVETKKSTDRKVINRTLQGFVVSTGAQKTIVVNVTRMKLHPKYLKRYQVSKKFHVHDPNGKFQVGDLVTFVACRPLSKTKRWRVV